MLPLLAMACLDAYFEAPFVLTAGLGEVRGISRSPTPERLLLATRKGTLEIDGEGHTYSLDAVPALDVTAHPDRIYALGEEGLRWRPWPTGRWQALSLPAPATTLQAWCEDELLLGGPSGLWRLPRQEPLQPPQVLPAPLSGVRQIVLSAAGCQDIYALTADAVWQVPWKGGPPTQLIGGLHDARALISDGDGVLWVVQGQPAALGRLRAGRLEVRARHVGDVRDAIFGTGGLLDPLHVFLASGAGRLDYVRVVPEP